MTEMKKTCLKKFDRNNRANKKFETNKNVLAISQLSDLFKTKIDLKKYMG